MLTWSLAIALYLVVTCSISFVLLRGPPTGLVAALIFFNCLNSFIAICEICLGRHISFIQADYRALQKKYTVGQEWDAVTRLLTTPVTIGEVFNGLTWARMWSTYALFDLSYQDSTSFGFFIDVGNGWTTLPPCLLLHYAILRPEASSPLWVGCVTIASYWQMLYGTMIYFVTFLFNRRYEGRPLASLLLFVITTNGVWIVFPAMAIYAAVCILRDGNFDVFGE